MAMIRDRVAIDLPAYEGLLAGHYQRGPGYGRKRPEGTDDWLLIMTLSGSGRFEGTEEFTVVAPQLILVSPGTAHDYSTARDEERWEILWVHFHPRAEWLDWLKWPKKSKGHFFLLPSDPLPIETAFRTIIEFQNGSTHHSILFAMNALERLLLVCLSQLPQTGQSIDPRVQQAINLMHKDLSLTHSIEQFGSLLGLSPSRFRHLFRQEVGIAPHQYLLQQRIQRGRQLLERTSLGVAEIAHAVGMDPIAFTLRFKAETSLSPRAFRKTSDPISFETKRLRTEPSDPIS